MARTPGAIYLTEHRRVWPPFLIDALPASVRWAGCESWPRNIGRLPKDAAGVLVFEFLNGPGEVLPGARGAVSVEAIRADGALVGDRWRRSHGAKGGARFVAAGQPDQPALLVEGELDALAATLMWPGRYQVLAAGSCGAIPRHAVGESVSRESLAGERVAIAPDDDDPGGLAYLTAVKDLRAAGQPYPGLFESAPDPAGALERRVKAEGWERVIGSGLRE